MSKQAALVDVTTVPVCSPQTHVQCDDYHANQHTSINSRLAAAGGDVVRHNLSACGSKLQEIAQLLDGHNGCECHAKRLKVRTKGGGERALLVREGKHVEHHEEALVEEAAYEKHLVGSGCSSGG
jgi:hypothetical protein